MLTPHLLPDHSNDLAESNHMHLQSKHLIVRTLGTTHVIPFEEIFFAEADSGYTILHFRNGNHLITCQVLSKIADQLPACQFLRIHQSYLIRIDTIRAYHRFASTIEIKGLDRKLPVAKAKKKSLHHILY